MALVCVKYTLVKKFQNVLPISPELSLSTLSTIFSSDTSTEEITASRRFKEMSPVTKIQIKYWIEKIWTFFLITVETNNIEEKRKKQMKNRVKEQRIRKFKQPQYFRSTWSENAENSQHKQIFIIKGQIKILKRNAASVGNTTCRQLRKMALGRTSELQKLADEFCSSYKVKCVE
jgi:hypothetical protein